MTHSCPWKWIWDEVGMPSFAKVPSSSSTRALAWHIHEEWIWDEIAMASFAKVPASSSTRALACCLEVSSEKYVGVRVIRYWHFLRARVTNKLSIKKKRQNINEKWIDQIISKRLERVESTQQKNLWKLKVGGKQETWNREEIRKERRGKGVGRSWERGWRREKTRGERREKKRDERREMRDRQVFF